MNNNRLEQTPGMENSTELAEVDLSYYSILKHDMSKSLLVAIE